MGISRLFAEMILREHAYRALAGEVLVVGRQYVWLSPSEATLFMQSMGVEPVHSKDLEMDVDTRHAEGKSISDRAFFQLLGLNKFKSLDVSDYEKADIIHDLSAPLPSRMIGIADVIVDGATLDNVFNPAQALISLAGMLRTGGRIFLYNIGSNHTCPYTILTPLWFYDYFISNAFSRVLVYASVRSNVGRNVFVVEPQNVSFTTPNIQSPYETMIMVLAERGEKSTHDRSPIQHQYRRPPAEDIRHRRNIESTLAAADVDLVKSDCQQFMDTPPGYKFISL